MLVIPLPIFAHYSMVFPESNSGRLGQPVTVVYQWGHPFEHQLSDAAAPAALTILTPSGKKIEAVKEMEAIDLPAPDGKKARAFRFRFIPQERGDFVFVFRTPPIWMEEDAAFFEDTVQVVLHVQVQKGWDAAPGSKMEISPLTRPYGLQAGMAFQARVRAEGRALAGTLVEVERYNSAPPAVLPPDEHITRTVKTDADGVVTISLMEPGWWSLTASRNGGKKDHQGKMYPIRERVTLWVFVDEPKALRSDPAKSKEKTKDSKHGIEEGNHEVHDTHEKHPTSRSHALRGNALSRRSMAISSQDSDEPLRRRASQPRVPTQSVGTRTSSFSISGGIPSFRGSIAAFPLFAVHISDGNVLTPDWLVGGYLLAGILIVMGSWGIRDEEIPQVGLLTAAFFVVSLIRVPIPGLPTSAHLLLNGLLGVVLGRRAALAIPIGLLLQAVLLQHGGLTTLGVNSCVMVLPALMAWQMFSIFQKLPGRKKIPDFAVGLVVGGSAVLATVLLNCLALLWGGTSDWRSLIVLTLVPHLLIAAIEGVILGFTVSFLARVKPQMLGGRVTRESSACLAEPQSQMA
jgi:cobalt/nickel transport system permease protein